MTERVFYLVFKRHILATPSEVSVVADVLTLNLVLRIVLTKLKTTT